MLLRLGYSRVAASAGAIISACAAQHPQAGMAGFGHRLRCGVGYRASLGALQDQAWDAATAPSGYRRSAGPDGSVCCADQTSRAPNGLLPARRGRHGRCSGVGRWNSPAAPNTWPRHGPNGPVRGWIVPLHPCKVPLHRCIAALHPCKVSLHRCIAALHPRKVSLHRCIATLHPCKVPAPLWIQPACA
jgi:hypothetical protein